MRLGSRGRARPCVQVFASLESEFLATGLGQPQVLTAQGCCGQLRPGRVSPVAGGISRLR